MQNCATKQGVGNMSELWQRIRAARKAAGLTQDKVAAAIGVTRAGVALWESNNPDHKTSPSLHNLSALSRAIGVPMDWLMDDKSDPAEAWKLFGPHRVIKGRIIDPDTDVVPDLEMAGYSVRFASSPDQLRDKYRSLLQSDNKRLLVIVGEPLDVAFAPTAKDALALAVARITDNLQA